MKFNPVVRTATAVVAIGALASLAACASTPAAPEEPDAGSSTGIEIPGATEDQAAKFNELYEAAVESGNTDIVFYGPSATTSTALLKVFTDRFPELSVTLKHLDMAVADKPTVTGPGKTGKTGKTGKAGKTGKGEPKTVEPPPVDPKVTDPKATETRPRTDGTDVKLIDPGTEGTAEDGAPAIGVTIERAKPGRS